MRLIDMVDDILEILREENRTRKYLSDEIANRFDISEYEAGMLLDTLNDELIILPSSRAIGGPMYYLTQKGKDILDNNGYVAYLDKKKEEREKKNKLIEELIVEYQQKEVKRLNRIANTNQISKTKTTEEKLLETVVALREDNIKLKKKDRKNNIVSTITGAIIGAIIGYLLKYM